MLQYDHGAAVIEVCVAYDHSVVVTGVCVAV